MNSPISAIDIEFYNYPKDKWSQGKYLIHGHDDSYWCNDIDEAMEIMKECVIKMNAWLKEIGAL